MAGPKKLIIFEDETELARLYQIILENTGFQIVRGDQHDLRCIDHSSVAVIDLMMPDVDGQQIMEHMVRHHPNCRRVLTTALYRVPVEIQNLAHVVLIKPFSAETLIEAVGVPYGTQGPQGPQGTHGTQGEHGTTGDQGIQGERGPRGERGPQGVAS